MSIVKIIRIIKELTALIVAGYALWQAVKVVSESTGYSRKQIKTAWKQRRSLGW